jgi:quinoprotein glucose dehydrogenase
MSRHFRLVWILSLLPFAACSADEPLADLDDPRFREWSVYHGDAGGSQYSSLAQIDRSNVGGLEVAWTFSTGDLTERLSQIQCNPIVVDAVLFCTSPEVKVFALRADTGEPIWTFDPFEQMPEAARHVNRAVVYWDDGGDDRRIFVVASWFLHALDADTGELIRDFGEDGIVDLRQGLGTRDVANLFVSATSPGIIYGDLLIQGTRVAERLPAAPGHLRAFDVRTGEIVWMFHTIPQPGEFGHETWPPEAYQYVGGANNWAGMSLDEERGIVYVPTGSATFDYYGGNRIGENLFANSLIAGAADAAHHAVDLGDVP